MHEIILPLYKQLSGQCIDLTRTYLQCGCFHKNGTFLGIRVNGCRVTFILLIILQSQSVILNNFLGIVFFSQSKSFLQLTFNLFLYVTNNDNILSELRNFQTIINYDIFTIMVQVGALYICYLLWKINDLFNLLFLYFISF